MMSHTCARSLSVSAKAANKVRERERVLSVSLVLSSLRGTISKHVIVGDSETGLVVISDDCDAVVERDTKRGEKEREWEEKQRKE